MPVKSDRDTLKRIEAIMLTDRMQINWRIMLILFDWNN